MWCTTVDSRHLGETTEMLPVKCYGKQRFDYLIDHNTTTSGLTSKLYSLEEQSTNPGGQMGEGIGSVNVQPGGKDQLLIS